MFRKGEPGEQVALLDDRGNVLIGSLSSEYMSETEGKGRLHINFTDPFPHSMPAAWDANAIVFTEGSDSNQKS